MKVKQFEIWIADLNPRMGTEAGKIRPVLVVQSDLLGEGHPSTIVCPITTSVSQEAEILRVHLKKAESGLKVDSDVLIDQLRTIDNRRLKKRVGTVRRETAYRVRDNLKVVLDLE